MSKKPTICFIAQNAYRAVSGDSGGHIGGSERQQSLMARWLAQRGYDVRIVVWDHGQADDLRVDGVRLIKLCRQDAGLPGLRFFYPRWTSLCRALRRADADVYYHNSAEYVTGQAAAWCRWKRRKFVYSVASDPTCDVDLPVLNTIRERVLYRHGLRRADRLIVQSRKQHDMLAAGFGLDSSILPMPCPDGAGDAYRPLLPGDRNAVVLWVGRIVPLKRLEWFLKLAGQNPGVNFEVAAGVGDESPYAAGLLAAAHDMKNVRVHSRVPFDEMIRLYRRALCLCCTSEYEGFPNTFLEAWSHGVPVVSTVDPDGLIAGRELGAVGSDPGELSSALNELLADPQRWVRASENSRRYFVENHTLEVAMPKFEAVFTDLFEERQSTTARALQSCSRE